MYVHAAVNELTLEPPNSFSEVPGYRGAPIYVPEYLPVNPNIGQVKLPTRLFWSGNRELDFRYLGDVKKGYKAIMSEGKPHDILAYLDRDTMLRVFDDMYLTPSVRAAWSPLIERERMIG